MHLFTDHKPLVSAFYSQKPAKSDRQQRQLAIISEYVSSVEHVHGSDNVVADALSRSISAIQIDFPDLSQIAHLQKNAGDIDEYRDRLTPFTLPKEESIL